MGKIVKILSVVAAVALAIPSGGTSLLAATLGVSSLAATAIVAGLTIGASLLAKRPKAPRTSQESIDRLNASIDPRTPRKGWLGTTAGNTDIRDQEYSDGQEYFHRFIVCAAHKTGGYKEIWFDDKKAWSSVGGVTADYSGYLTVTTITEGSAGNAINISARMGSTRRFTGCSYVYLRYKLTGNSKKTESPFAQGIPSRMTIVGDGALTYDPRLDSTRGGSGSHRADDQSTWAWDSSRSRNPAILLLWYLLGWRIGGEVSIGCGIPPERIDFDSFITAANLCDETVSLTAGGTEPRYRADGVFSDGDDPTNVIDSLKAAMNADLDDVGGKFRLTVFHNDLGDPSPLFTDDDMIEGFRWVQTPALSENFNIVRGSYVDARNVALYQLVDAPQVEIASNDGIDRFDNFTLDKVQSPSQWQRLAKQRLQRQLYGGEFSTTFGVRGWLLRKNMVLRLTFSRLGWTEKLFRVAEMEHRVDGTCPVVLREENEAIYAWDEDEAPAVEPADPTVYDFTLTPLYQGIGEAAATAEWSEIVDDDGNKPEDNADVTANAQVIVVPAATYKLYRTSAGAVKADQLPADLLPTVTRGGTDIRTDNSVSYSVTGYEGLAGKVSVNNTPGSADKGTVTVQNTVTGEGYFELSVTVGGVAVGVYKTMVETVDDLPAINNAGAGGTDTTLKTITSTTYDVMTGQDAGDQTLDVAITSGQVLKLNANFKYQHTPSTATGTPLAMKCKAQYFAGGVWNDMDGATTEVTGTPSTAGAPEDRIKGEIVATFEKPGLATATYPVRLLGKFNSSATGNLQVQTGGVTSFKT